MTIGWAIVGTGRVHQLVAPAIKGASGTKLVAVLSRDRARAGAFAEEHGIAGAYGELDELLRDPALDVVYVASPNGLHAEQTIQIAEAGKHVFCEKPMAPTLEGCHAMIEACTASGVKLGLALQYRQHPAHIKMRQIVASGELGQLVFANTQVEIPPLWAPDWYYQPELAGGGVLYMVGVHRIDLLRFILDSEVEEVSAFIGERTAQRPFEDMVAAMLRFANGLYCTLHFSLKIPHGTNTFDVHGTQGSLFGVDTTNLWWGGAGGEVLLKGAASTTTHRFEKTDVYRDEVEDFNRCITEDGEPLATGTDGLRAAEISLAIFESAQHGKSVRIADVRGSR